MHASHSLFLCLISVNPVVGDIESDQRRSVRGGCWVLVSWNVPKNFSVHEISHFMVYLNGTQVENELLKNKTVVMKVYQVCTCDVHMFNISAVDTCGNIGKSISLRVENPEALPDAAECGEDPTTIGLGPASSNDNDGTQFSFYSDHGNTIINFISIL